MVSAWWRLGAGQVTPGQAGGGTRFPIARLPHARAIGTWAWYGWPSPALSPPWPGRAVAPGTGGLPRGTGRDPVAILRGMARPGRGGQAPSHV